MSPAELRRAVRVAAAGDALLSPAVTRTVLAAVAAGARSRPDPALLDGLTAREREVPAGVALGETTTEIGARLHISPATARTDVSRLLGKLGARDRAALVVLGYESGLVRPGERPA